VPRVNAVENLQTYKALHAAIKGGFVRSCHDLSEGGLAVAAAEMAFAGGIGVTLNGDLTAADLFAESNGRFVVEVEPANAAAFSITVKSTLIGTTTTSNRLEAGSMLDVRLLELKAAWQEPLS